MKRPILIIGALSALATLTALAVGVYVYGAYARWGTNPPWAKETAATVAKGIEQREETIGQRADNLKRIEQNFELELTTYLKGRFGHAYLGVAGHVNQSGERVPDDTIGMFLVAKEVGVFTDEQLAGFSREIGLYYLMKNPYIDSCKVMIFSDVFAEGVRITEVERHEGIEKEYAKGYKILFK